jgi:hypothetical protein
MASEDQSLEDILGVGLEVPVTDLPPPTPSVEELRGRAAENGLSWFSEWSAPTALTAAKAWENMQNNSSEALKKIQSSEALKKLQETHKKMHSSVSKKSSWSGKTSCVGSTTVPSPLTSVQQCDEAWKVLEAETALPFEKMLLRTQVVTGAEAKMEPPAREFVWPAITKVLSEISYADYNGILDNGGDLRNEVGSGKQLCANGWVCRASWVSVDGGGDYTGLFQGSEAGIVRLSSALSPMEGIVLPFTLRQKILDSKLFPCIAIKFFRSSAQSGNMLAAGTKTGQANSKFFEHAQSTSISESMPYVARWILEIFRRYSKHPTQLGISDFAAAAEDGVPVVPSALRFPWMVTFAPVDSLAEAPFDRMGDIEAGTKLYDIYACDSPNSAFAEGGLGFKLIDKLVQTSAMLPSDSKCGLFFKHQRREEDYEKRPDWVPELTSEHANVGAAHCESQIKLLQALHSLSS